jgi:hypothetical protein
LRHRPAGSFELERPVSAAFGLFTPEGERSWVPGWDPHYPAGQVSEEPGTVFSTTAAGVQTTWLVIKIDRDGHTASYARLTPGQHAGSVHVRLEALDSGGSQVHVSYDMTRLADAPEAALATYDPKGFGAMLDEWQALIRDYLSKESRS